MAAQEIPLDRPAAPRLVLDFEEFGIGDIARVGAKNASLGEMTRQLAAQGIRVPGGFAITADAYRAFLASAGLAAPLGELFAGGVPV